jgi:RNA polymerase sigma-70 factor (ECF subfamily)
MTRNLAFDRLRRSAWETSIDDVAEDDLSIRSETGHQTEERIDLQNALNALAFQDRQIVMLKAVAGLPAKEISQLLGIPPSTVHWRYHRSLKLLADRLKGGLQ